LTIDEAVIKDSKKQCIDDGVSLSSIVQELLTIWTSGSPLFREMITFNIDSIEGNTTLGSQFEKDKK